jgi:hypothetical protein
MNSGHEIPALNLWRLARKWYVVISRGVLHYLAQASSRFSEDLTSKIHSDRVVRHPDLTPLAAAKDAEGRREKVWPTLSIPVEWLNSIQETASSNLAACHAALYVA